MSFATFVSETATVFSAPEASTIPSRAACASNGIGRRRDLEAGLVREQLADARGELRMRVEAGAGRGAAERDLAEPRQRVADARDALAHLRCVAGELLAERDRDGVHPVRPARLDDVVELLRLRLERGRELLHRRQQVVRDLVERREMHGRREDVVRGLAHVDVVVRVDVLAGERGDHLVRVHVRGRARAGLEDVDRELVVELARRDPGRGGRDPLRLVAVEQAEVGVRARGGALDAAEPARDRRRDRLAGDREVRDRLRRLAAPELLPLLGLRHQGECREGARGRRRRNYATEARRCSTRAGSRGARVRSRSPRARAPSRGSRTRGTRGTRSA